MERPLVLLVTALGLIVLAAPCLAEAEPPAAPAKRLLVKAKSKPDQQWKEYETRTLDQLAGFHPGARAVALSKYGGRLDRRVRATGFFRVEKIGERWWLVDPEGCLFIHVGVCSIATGRSAAVQAALQEKFGDDAKWADATARLLKEHGFNGAGAWSSTSLLRNASQPVAYTLMWNFMSTFGKTKNLTHQQPGHTGYANDCIPVFHPDFPAFCDQHARALAATKDDPWLLGHFSDNEMPGLKDLLDKFLKLDPSDPGRKAAEEWLAQRKGKGASAKDLTDADRDEWRGLVFERYYEITTKAIRKYDPHHLCLGSRLHGAEKNSPAVFRGAGRFLEAIAVNYYGAWTPDARTLANWTAWSGRPVLITEWYTKGADTPLKNSTGAGWIVPTQEDRGRFYQNYTLALLESKTCVGWHWFKYMDNDPADLSTDPSNRDSNKGIVTIRFEPYAPLMERMKAINPNVYGLADYFDSQRGKP